MFIVIYLVCLIFSSCHTYSRHHKGSEIKNEIHMRVKTGTPLMLKCRRNTAVWEFKPCCGKTCGLCNRSINEHDDWSKVNSTKGRVIVDAAGKNDSGIYKCYEGQTIRRTFIVDVIPPGYDGFPPYVAPLKTSNLTSQVNMEFTIQCNVTSEVPPTIFWFKTCYGQKCDIKLNKICFCHLTNSISSYNTSNIYISKFSIFNARDVDTGMYTCLAITQFGENSQNVTILVPANHLREDGDSFPLLFLIPAVLLLIPLLLWIFYHRRRKKSVVIIVHKPNQLIRPIDRTNFANEEIL